MIKSLLVISLFSFKLFSFSQERTVAVEVHCITGYGDNEEFALRAAKVLEIVLNSKEFKSEVLSMEYAKTKGLTNDQLFKIIMNAHEEQGKGGQDGIVDLRLRTIRINGDENNWKKNCEPGSRSGTIGIDGQGDGVMAICPQILDQWAKENNFAELAGHYAHEYIHILGFDHYRIFSTPTWREKTFVYQIGNIVSKLANELVAQEKKENKQNCQ